MTRQAKKERERYYLERFFLAHGESLEKVVDGEAPDFVVKPTHKNEEIGIEVTEIFRLTEAEELPRQAIETFQAQVLARAEQLWEIRKGPNIEVWAHFNRDFEFKSGNVEAFAEELVSAVERSLPAPSTYRIIHCDWDNYDWFPNSLSYFAIARLPTYSQSYWHVSDADFLPVLTPKELQTVISQKNEADYSIKDGSSWLVIVADGTRPSSSFEIRAVMLDAVYESRFDRTFLFDPMGDHLFQLKTRKP